MDDDLDGRSRDLPIATVKKLRAGIRAHRDATGHDLGWHQPSTAVPPWAKFMRGCIRYRQALDEEAPGAPVHDKEFNG